MRELGLLEGLQVVMMLTQHELKRVQKHRNRVISYRSATLLPYHLCNYIERVLLYQVTLANVMHMVAVS
jgi:hypothetical protein